MSRPAAEKIDKLIVSAALLCCAGVAFNLVNKEFISVATGTNDRLLRRVLNEELAATSEFFDLAGAAPSELNGMTTNIRFACKSAVTFKNGDKHKVPDVQLQRLAPKFAIITAELLPATSDASTVDCFTKLTADTSDRELLRSSKLFHVRDTNTYVLSRVNP